MNINIFRASVVLFFASIICLTAQNEEYKRINKFHKIYSSALKNHVDETDADKLLEDAINGMLEKLDPHSAYFNPEKMQKIQEDLEGNFNGIGITYTVIRDTINIIAVNHGGPADLAGVMTADKIIRIDDMNAIALDNQAIENLLRGKYSSIVKLTIIRQNEKEPLDIEATRDKIMINSVNAAFIIDGTDIGLISLNRFRENTFEEFIDSLNSLNKKGMKKLILDLRGNPGGYFKHAPKIADEFLQSGSKIVYTIGRRPEFNEVYYSTNAGRYENIPLIVLIDAGTASSSEIVSGAIQDLDRGLIIGETSYGKGLVQRQYNLGDGSAFRITTAKYYTPSGRCIQRPYNDMIKYKNFEGRFEMKEDETIEQALDRIKKEKGSDSLPELFKTSKGRTVIGNGGITPDYAVKYETITKLSKDIKSKNLFNGYVLNNIEKIEQDISIRYKKNFSTFLHKYSISSQMLDEFKSSCINNDIIWNEEQFTQDLSYIRTYLKATIARTIWGLNECMSILLPESNYVKRAIQLFPEAENLAGLN